MVIFTAQWGFKSTMGYDLVASSIIPQMCCIIVPSFLFQGKKKKLSKSGKSTKSTPTKGSASLADVVDDDAALQQVL